MNKDEYAAHIVQELIPLGEVVSKKMFGGIGIFLNSIMFAMVSSRGVLYFRVDDTNRVDYEAMGAEQFNPVMGKKSKGMPYYTVPAEIIDDHDKLVTWARKAHKVAVANKKR